MGRKSSHGLHGRDELEVGEGRGIRSWSVLRHGQKDASITYILRLKTSRASPGIVRLGGTWKLRANHRHYNLTLGESQISNNVYLHDESSPGP